MGNFTLLLISADSAIYVLMLNELHGKVCGPYEIGIEATEDMTLSNFEASTDTLREAPLQSSEWHSSLPNFISKNPPQRCRFFPNSTIDLTYSSLQTGNHSFDDFSVGISDFKEDLTTEIALFHACEDVICTLEASLFSARLPKSQQKTERILVDSDDLLDPMPFTSSKSFSNFKHFSSLPNLLELQEKKIEDSFARCCSLHRLSVFNSSGTLHFKDASTNNNTEEADDMVNFDSCQTALVSGGLVRAVLQDTFPPVTRLPLRIRQLQERVATMSDTDWVVKYQKSANYESNDFTNEGTRLGQFGLRNVSSFSTLFETDYRQNKNFDVVDPLLSPFEINTGSTPSSPFLSTKQQLPLVGVENFFYTGSTTNEQTPIQQQQQKAGSMSRLNWVSSKNLIISPIIPREKRKGILMSQQNRCFGCGIYVETKYLRSMRFCEYFGRFFCSMCHSNTLMVLPGALVQTWSGTMYPVSKFARDLLTPLHNLPLLHSADFGPELRRKPQWTLLDAIQLRKQAMAIVPFLKLCHDSKYSLF
ncbi:unnamed protein product [Rodentolepis nana]|uniref:Rubicon Homology domain-containing protein n=1 Tax=Rodentolepis nana TaxID=102285 RepID=A0A3P7S5V6_RODNA|nr:unnamed protein product [Rodentolepis nana]